MKRTYRVKLAGGDSFLMEANMVQAAAPIWVNWIGDEDTWQNTPFQTADARHLASEAAKLVARYFEGPDECPDVIDIEEITADCTDAD